MKILVLIDAWFPFFGGAQIQIKNLQKILEKKYYLKFFILHSPSSKILIRFLWSLWVIPQAIILHLKEHFDLIHAHAYWPGVSAKIISLLIKIPLVFTIHGSNLMDIKEKSLKAFLERIILTKIKYDKVISVSANFLKYKNVNKNIVVIPNGVDVNFFKKNLPKKKKHSRILKILYIGRLEKIKGVDYLIVAFAKAFKKIKNINLTIIGEGKEKGKLKKQVKELKIIEKVIFKKNMDLRKLINEYFQADVFVLPSLAEGQPLTLLEAWAAKLPLVATSVGDNSLLVENGINGYLAKPADSNDLADKIIKILKDKKRKKLGFNGFQLVQKNFTWEKCAQKTYQVYLQLL